MKENILQNVYEMVRESRLEYAVDIWGLEDTWKETDKIRGRLCKKIRRHGFIENGEQKWRWEYIVGGARYCVWL
jgi:hypothetical protein